MKTVQIEYATVSPLVLEMVIKRAYPTAICYWKEVSEDYFEFTVFGVADLAMLEDVLAEYVQGERNLSFFYGRRADDHCAANFPL